MPQIDEVKLTHHNTPQIEFIMKLHSEIQQLLRENDELRQKVLFYKKREMEQMERLNDYKDFIKAMNKLEALESWLNDDDE